MNTLRSLAFYAVFYTASVLYVLAALLMAWIAPARLIGVATKWSRCHRACARYILGIKLREIGERPAEPAFYALRHETFFEAIDLPALLDRPAVFAKEELFAIPGWGRAAAHYGLIPVARTEGAKTLRNMVRAARQVLQVGRPLAIFPEGTRIPHGRAAPLQAGFAGLYKVLNQPVVPVAVDSGRLYTGFVKRPGTLTVRFGAPIPPGLPRAEIEARVLAEINALNPPGTLEQAAMPAA